MTFKYTAPQIPSEFHGGGLRVVDNFRTHRLVLPSAVEDASALHARLTERRRAIPDERSLRVATVAAFLDDATDAAISELAFVELEADVKHGAAAEAVDRAREDVTRKVLQHADEMLATVRAELFDPALDVLTTVANTAHLTPTEAHRSGDHQAVTALLELPHAAQRIEISYRLRRSLYPRFNWGRCGVWRDPTGDVIDHAKNTESIVEEWVGGIRRGGQLWLGSAAEVDDANTQLAQREKAGEREHNRELAAASVRPRVR